MHNRASRALCRKQLFAGLIVDSKEFNGANSVRNFKSCARFPLIAFCVFLSLFVPESDRSTHSLVPIKFTNIFLF